MNDAASQLPNHGMPLFVDLDDTLIATDILWEQIIRLIFHKPYLIPSMIWFGLKGKARFKEWLSKKIDLPVEYLPWSKAVIDYARKHKDRGGLLILSTATHENIALKINEHLGIFDAVLATNGDTNLKGSHKAQAITEYNVSLNKKHYAYVGDSVSDIPIWEKATEAWMVSGRPSLESRCRKAVPHLKVLEAREVGYFSNWIKLLRVRQWSKNILLFLPLLLAHKILNPTLFATASAAALSFCFAASGVYLFNDTSDVFKDRSHPLKKLRPLASGSIRLWQGFGASLILVLLSVSIALLSVGIGFALILLLYLVSNALYTCWIKSVAILDVVLLSLFYSLRIFAGGVAVDVEVSKWLLAFSLFFFLSLAFGKRYQEILLLNASKGTEHTRGYIPGDQSIISICGISSGFVSVMVLVLYVNSPEVLRLYHIPDLLWLLAPLGIYWVARFWMLTARGLMHDDPVFFALKDRLSWGIGIAALIILTIAHFVWIK
jgi:4-hydroxybenzoate polyprenyltransferase/phosphoserine phosphatase